MAHRMKTVTNGTNFESESLRIKTRKDDKYLTSAKQSNVQKCPRYQSHTATLNTNFSLFPSGRNFKWRPPSPKMRCEPVKVGHPNVEQQRRKSVTRDDAVVRPTPTHSRGRPRSGGSKPVSKEESWSKLLESNTATSTSTPFNNFDPLRTLHFIGKELQSKLNSNTCNDPNVLQMAQDIEVVLNRIPPDVVSLIKKGPSKGKTNKEERGTNILGVLPEGNPATMVQITKPKMIDKGCVTVQNNSNSREADKFHKQLEASALKLDTHCKQIEKQLVSIKKEKDQIEHLLQSEKDIVKFLRKQIEDIQAEKVLVADNAYQEVLKERDSLRNQLKKRENFDDSKLAAVQGYKSSIEELQTEKANAKRENLALRHKLTISNMERDKFIAILNIRDSQISEIRQEMVQLQGAVNDQLSELQKNSYISVPSSQETIIDTIGESLWQQLGSRIDKAEDSAKEMPSISQDSTLKTSEKMKFVPHSFHDLLSCDSSSNTNFDYTSLKMNKNGCAPESPPQKEFKDRMLTNNGKDQVEKI